MLSTTASYLAVSANLTRSQSIVAADPAVKRDTAYYLANIGKVTSVGAFVGNYRLFSYAMKAYGLGDMTYAKAFITKVLNGGTSGASALANQLSDKRYLAFAKAFDFAGQGATATSATSATTGTTARYVEQTLEETQGKQNTGVQLALYFKRNASAITSAYGLLADSAIYKVVQTIFGISPYAANADVDSQARYLGKVVNIKDLQDPAKVEKLVERFTAMWDASGNNKDQTASSALLVGDTASGIGPDLLMSLAGLRLGG